MITVLLADGEALVRAGLRLVLSHADDVEIVAEAADGDQAVALAELHHPDVALVDVRMPGTDGIAAAARLAALVPPIAVVMLTTFGEEKNVAAALCAGANGFLLKDTPPQELIEAVRAAAAGEAVLSPAVIAHVVRQLRESSRRTVQEQQARQRIEALTAREREVLTMVGAGLANTEIAQRLGVETGTVKVHVGRLFAKLGAGNRVQAALIAYRAGLTG
ncbi:response regulator transcription factor [Streptomyces sp. NPDC052496]|uniref:response regulator transcription factor n=1 Tax=Streptomyces sp. NPDC052496 TaxID=3154951 RepID=UPI00344AE091